MIYQGSNGHVRPFPHKKMATGAPTGALDFDPAEFGLEDGYLEEKRPSLLDVVRETLQKEGKVCLKHLFDIFKLFFVSFLAIKVALD